MTVDAVEVATNQVAQQVPPTPNVEQKPKVAPQQAAQNVAPKKPPSVFIEDQKQSETSSTDTTNLSSSVGSYKKITPSKIGQSLFLAGPLQPYVFGDKGKGKDVSWEDKAIRASLGIVPYVGSVFS